MKPQYGPDPKADVVMLVGVDPSEELPILDVHLKRSIRRGKMKVIVVHPRKVELTRYDGPFLQLKPGTEVTLLNGLTRMALGKVERRPAAAGELEAFVAEATDERLRSVTGVEPAAVREAAELLAKARNAVIIYGPMVARGPAGEATAAALTNLAIAVNAADRLAYVGLEANSQGCRDMGVLPSQLPGHQPVADEKARRALEKSWGGSIPAAAGKSYTQMLDDAGRTIKALFIMGANPATERPRWEHTLDQLDFLVVQDLFLTETAQRADVVLPAVSWAESDGTFTNLERRVQRAPMAVRNTQSKAATDWMILDHLAARFGVNWPYADNRAITAEISKVVPQYHGLTWEALGDQGAQWDAAKARRPLKPRRAEQPYSSAAGGDFALVSGTVLYDSGTLFSQTEAMRAMSFGEHVALHPDDAARMGVADGDLLALRSDGGSAVLAARIDASVRPGTLWIPEGLPDAPAGALQSDEAVTHLSAARAPANNAQAGKAQAGKAQEGRAKHPAAQTNGAD
jgi:predicted molibdopterin-dependent oxidoreductase YjgC